jgi:formate hydrogenlyase subunit 3/multisubunit Na+/H+ antiporter MnhD subunit
MLLAIITAWLAYKRARENGRNPILWAAIGVCVFIGIQFAVTLGAGIALGLGGAFYGWPETTYDRFSIPITLVAMALSFAGSWFLLRYLERPLVPEASFSTPPPPPDFGGSV